jgi:hypothetical protein
MEQLGHGYGGMDHEGWIGLVFARNDPQRGSGAIGGFEQDFKAVGPIGFPSQKANNNHLGLAEDGFSVGINREFLLELEQVNAPHCWKGGGELGDRPSQNLNIGIGSAENNDGRWGLLNEDHALRGGAGVKTAGDGREAMQGVKSMERVGLHESA